MSQPERAHISVVTPGSPGEPGAAAVDTPHTAQSRGLEPEAMPPVPPQQPEETEPTLGGPTMPVASTEEIVAATGGSLTERMRARFTAMEDTKEFPVPGWELADGSPGLILVAKTFGDRKAYNEGVSNEAFLAKATHQLIFINDDGERELIEGRWGPTLAGMIGAPEIKRAADLVARVISKPDPANRGQRIPNVAGISSLAIQIVNWASTATAKAENDLGE